MTTTKDSRTEKMFPYSDAIRGDKAALFFCGHFDGHDVYRRFNVDLWVLVYGNATETICEVCGSQSQQWEAEHNLDAEWGAMRAIVKARQATIEWFDRLIQDTRTAMKGLPTNVPNTYAGFPSADDCLDTMDWLERFRKRVGV
jgi:hypothetical protein